MNITLTPEIEEVLSSFAKKQGTTIELLALKTLRERFFSKEIQPLKKTIRQQSVTKSLADRLAGYIGSIDSSEIVNGGAQMSKNSRKKFGEILLEKQQRSKL